MIGCLVFGFIVCVVLCGCCHQKLLHLKTLPAPLNEIYNPACYPTPDPNQYRDSAIMCMEIFRGVTWGLTVALFLIAFTHANTWQTIVLAPVMAVWLAGTVWMFFINGSST